jgi:hypothetical protein
MMAALQPKHSERTVRHDFERMSDDEIAQTIQDIRTKLGRVEGDRDMGASPTGSNKLN